MSNGWLEVVNLEKLAKFSRKVIYYNFDESNSKLNDESFMEKIENISNEKDDEEMERLLPYKEIEAIFGEFLQRKKSKETKKKAWFLKEKDYNIILEQLSERMVSNIVRGLVNRGLVESAFDSEKNDFVFWVKGNEDKRKEKDK
jgi:hypothetical protein